MSLVIGVISPDGIVLAADTRLTLKAKLINGCELRFPYDNATKIFSFSPPHNYIGVLFMGKDVIGDTPVRAYMPLFECSLGNKRLPVKKFATKMAEFFHNLWAKKEKETPADQGIRFTVLGFDEGALSGTAYFFGLPDDPIPHIWDKEKKFGMFWAGETFVANRIAIGFDERLFAVLKRELKLKLNDDELARLFAVLSKEFRLFFPFHQMTLQDCVDIAALFVRSTIEVERLAITTGGVGGGVEVAIITPQEGFRFLNKQEIVVKW